MGGAKVSSMEEVSDLFSGLTQVGVEVRTVGVAVWSDGESRLPLTFSCLVIEVGGATVTDTSLVDSRLELPSLSLQLMREEGGAIVLGFSVADGGLLLPSLSLLQDSGVGGAAAAGTA